MSICEKCFMDPCLCHLDGFGPEDEEETTKKELNELMGRKCIVKTTHKGNGLFMKGIPGFQISDRLTDVTGKIVKMQVIVDPTIREDYAPLIDLHLDDADENSIPPDIHPLPIFYIEYDEQGTHEVPGHWYIDEEVLYI